MPHTTRPTHRPALPSAKPTTTTTADGWSTIARRSKPNRRTSHQQPILRQDTSDSDDLAARLRRLDLGAAEDLTSAQREYCRRLAEEAEGRGNGVVEFAAVFGLGGPRPQRARLTGEEVRSQYEWVRKAWLGSKGRGRVEGLLRRVGCVGCVGEEEDLSRVDDGCHEEKDGEGKMIPDGDGKRFKVTKAVCLGLGSPSADNSGWRAVVAWQLVVFLGVVEMVLQSSSRRDGIKLYAQDPIFNTLDTSFLASLNITVLPTPKAFELIDSETLIYAPHFPLACWPAQMRRGKAAMVVGNDVESALPRIPTPEALRMLFARLAASAEGGNADGRADAELIIPDLDAKEEFDEFLRAHESAAWPEPEEAEHAFNNMRAYWRRNRREEEPERGGGIREGGECLGHLDLER